MGNDPSKCLFSEVEIGRLFIYNGRSYRKIAETRRTMPSEVPWVSGYRPARTVKTVNAKNLVTGELVLFTPNEVVAVAVAWES